MGPGIVSGQRLDRHRPGPRSPGGVDQQVACDPEQPGPDWPLIGPQLGQVTPGPDEGLLHDVVGARPVRAESLDVTVQGPGVLGVQVAEGGIGVAGELIAGSLRDSWHTY